MTSVLARGPVFWGGGADSDLHKKDSALPQFEELRRPDGIVFTVHVCWGEELAGSGVDVKSKGRLDWELGLLSWLTEARQPVFG